MKQLLDNSVEQLSRIIAEPLWQFSDSVIETVIQSAFEELKLECLRLNYNESIREPLEKGECEQGYSNNISASYPVVYKSQLQEFDLGYIYASRKFEISIYSILNQVKDIVFVSVLLYFVLAIATLRAFHFKLLKPLYVFLDSTYQYKKTGERVLIDYKSDDEIGDLVSLYNEGLEKQIKTEMDLKQAVERTENTLGVLKSTQAELIQAEKMASLGSLVAGVSHEINTPIGNAVTVSTAILDKTSDFSRAISIGQIKKSELSNYLNFISDGSSMLVRNLQRASELIVHFKQLSVDQTSSGRRKFELKNIIEDVLITLKPTFKNTPHSVCYEVDDSQNPIYMDSFPGPLGQVVTNIICNSLIHAYREGDIGSISISARLLSADLVQIIISDDGIGIDSFSINKVFDPFYSTRFGQGGSGLGMHICYNLVTGVLGGKINIQSELGSGTRVIIDIPLVAPTTD